MTIEVSLPDELGTFVDVQVTSARYVTADDDVRGLLDVEALITEARAHRE